MSTRAVYSFIEGAERHHVYKHHDGYPSGAAQHIAGALAFAWELPRFESDEFAAAFVAHAKSETKAGGVRLIAALKTTPCKTVASSFACDLAYRYEITAKKGQIFVKAFSTSYWDKPVEEKIWEGPLAEMAAWAEQHEKQDA